MHFARRRTRPCPRLLVARPDALVPFCEIFGDRQRFPYRHAIIDKATGKASGVASYLRIEPAVGVIEVGHINYAPALQRTTAATEAMYLLMTRVFDGPDPD